MRLRYFRFGCTDNAGTVSGECVSVKGEQMTEEIAVMILKAACFVGALLWCGLNLKLWHFKRNREHIFRRELRNRGYSKQAIDRAVLDFLND